MKSLTFLVKSWYKHNVKARFGINCIVIGVIQGIVSWAALSLESLSQQLLQSPKTLV